MAVFTSVPSVVVWHKVGTQNRVPFDITVTHLIVKETENKRNYLAQRYTEPAAKLEFK